MRFVERKIFLFLLLSIWTAVFSFAAERVTGANATLDIVSGAQSAAVGGATLIVPEEPVGLFINSWQLARTSYAWGSFAHVAYYEGTTYDVASLTLPLGLGHALGVSFSRFGADDIPWIKEGEAIPEGESYRTLSIADWTFSIAYGRQILKNLDLGITLHGLYRELDQTGFGFRGDASVRWLLPYRFAVAGLLKGWTSSAAKWESGTFEYESPEFYTAASWNIPIPYFYGTLGVYWQSAGLFHREARELDFDGEERGGRIWEKPLDWLSGGRGGVEFVFDFGLSLRAGLSSFTTLESVTAGAGFVLSEFLKIDYAFESHPALSSVHRVSVSVSPWLFFHKKQKQRFPEARSASNEKPLTAGEEQEIEQEESFDNAPETMHETQNSSTEENDKQSTENELSEELNLNPYTTETENEILEPAGGLHWEE